MAKDRSDTGKIIPLPLEEQSGEIRSIIERANEETPVQLFSKMVEASDKLDALASINRTNKAQFADPIRKTLLMTHVFLQGCENLSTIDTKAKKEQFDSFLFDQVKHRMMLMKRISGDEAEHYRQCNTVYAPEMEAIEKAELEKQMKKQKKTVRTSDQKKKAK